MSLQLDKTNKLQRTYSFLIKKEDLETAVDEGVAKLLPRIKLDGYRKGKIPPQIVKERNLKGLLSEAFSSALEREIAKEIKDKNIKLATQPSLENVDSDFSRLEDIRASISFEVQPTLPEIDYQKIEAECPELQMTSEEIEEELRIIAGAHFTEEEIAEPEAKIKEGHIANIDFEGFVDGVPFKNGAAKGYKIEVGSNTFIPGFESQLVGSVKGQEVEIKVPFPKDYHAKDVAGKEATFKVRVNAILEKKIPQMNDDFAKTLGMKDLSDLKEKMQSEIAAAYSDSFINFIRRRLMDVILEKHEFDVPQGLVQKEIESKMSEIQKSPESEGKPTKTEKEMKAESEKALMIWYIISNIASENGISVTDKEIDSFISRISISQQIDNPALLFQIYNSNPSLKNSLKQKLKEGKVVSFLLGKINKKNKPLSKKEFADYLKSLEESDAGAWKIKRKGFFSV